MVLNKVFLQIKSFIRNIYALLLCTQNCIICKAELDMALPLCDACIKSQIEEPLQFRIEHAETFCQNCSRRLISEKELCTRCRSDSKNICDKIYSIYPYQARIGTSLIQWKNFNKKVFAELFAQVIFKFLNANTELKDIGIVPVPPRPKKCERRVGIKLRTCVLSWNVDME